MDSTQLFGADKEVHKKIEEVCVEYLKYLGYKVVKRPTITTIIKVEDLVSHFYALMDYYHGEFCSLTSSKGRDLSTLSNFVKYRKTELHCSTKAAINDCAMIMSTIIINEKELGLNRQVGIWVFGTDKCKWITDKAISLMNDDYDKHSEESMLNKAKEFSDRNIDNYEGYDMDEIIKRRKLNG